MPAELLFCGPITTGTCTTGKWVHNGLVFTAKDAVSGNVIGSVTAQVSNPAGTLTFASNPIYNTGSPGDVVATLNYSANVPAQVYVGGTLFCGSPTALSGSCTTGQWVSNGLQFQLVDVATKAVLATATAQVQLSAGTATISISPNPALVTDGSGLAAVTVAYSASVPTAALFVNGTLLCGPQISAYCATGKWVTNGMVFTLANTANGLTIASATAVVQAPSGTISLAPNPVVAAPGSTLGIATVNYSANVGAEVYVNGRLLCGPGLSGSCETGAWVSNGLVFQLVSTSNHAVLASVTAQVVPPSGQISLAPNPVVVTDGSGLGVATVNYSANVPVLVYAGPTEFCGGTVSGSCQTGKWVSNGLVFSLVEVGTNTVLGTVTASVVSGP